MSTPIMEVFSGAWRGAHGSSPEGTVEFDKPRPFSQPSLRDSVFSLHDPGVETPGYSQASLAGCGSELAIAGGRYQAPESFRGRGPMLGTAANTS